VGRAIAVSKRKRLETSDKIDRRKAGIQIEN